MLLLGLLAAMMLVTSPVLAHQGGAHHGNKYSKNYYPNGCIGGFSESLERRILRGSIAMI
jgi:hypothetical protein